MIDIGKMFATAAARDLALQRAEKAEAALARVRAVAEYFDVWDPTDYDRGRMDALDAVLAALDGTGENDG